MEQSLFTEAIKGLVASGPVALVLGLVCWKVWSAYQDLQRDFVAFLKEIAHGGSHGSGEGPH